MSSSFPPIVHFKISRNPKWRQCVNFVNQMCRVSRYYKSKTFSLFFKTRHYFCSVSMVWSFQNSLLAIFIFVNRICTALPLEFHSEIARTKEGSQLHRIRTSCQSQNKTIYILKQEGRAISMSLAISQGLCASLGVSVQYQSTGKSEGLYRKLCNAEQTRIWSKRRAALFIKFLDGNGKSMRNVLWRLTVTKLYFHYRI